MDRFFAILGKVLLGIILLVAVLGAGYYIGTAKNKTDLTPSPTASPTTIPQITTLPSLIPSPTPSPTTTETKIISAGLKTGTSFKPYTIHVPKGWNDKKETTPEVIDKLTLTKEDYSLIVYQAAIGGGGCIYKGDPPKQMAQSFGTFAEIQGTAGTFRRSWNTDVNTHISYTICQKGNENSFSSVTEFGKIDVVSPSPADEKILSEIDAMIASLQKQ